MEGSSEVEATALSELKPLRALLDSELDVHFLVLSEEVGIELALCGVACPPELEQRLHACAEEIEIP